MEHGKKQKIVLQKFCHNKHNNKNKVKCKTRRGNWKKSKQNGLQNFKFSLLGTNCNGIFNKQESLKAAMSAFKSSGN